MSADSNIRVASLDHLWWGVCAGGRHYTGEVRWAEKTHELERKLSLKEAKEIGETQTTMWIRRYQRTTNKFDTLATLENAAARWCRENIEGEWALFHHDGHNPNRLISASYPWLMERRKVINEFADLWATVPNSVRENKDVWNTTFAAWRIFLTPPEERTV